MMRIDWLRTALLPLLLLTAAAPAPSPVYRTFGRWVVGCDNTRSCEARGFGETGEADMRVLRSAGDARATVVLSGVDPSAGGDAIHLDGKALRIAFPPWRKGKDDPSDPATFRTDDPAAVGAFLAAVRDGHSMQVGGKEGPTIPLDGVRAALLLVDAVHGRPGTASPLVAAAGHGQVPVAPPLPQPPAWHAPAALTAAETHALVARAKGFPSPPDFPCDRTEDADVYALDATSALVIRQCYLAAYQGSALVYVLPRDGSGAAVPVVLPLPGVPKGEDGGNVEGPEMVDPEFDPKVGRLYVTEKARGPGDCGQAAAWAWSAGAFHMTSLHFLDQCGDPEPGDFLTLFRSADSG